MRKAVIKELLIETASSEKLSALLEDKVKTGIAEINPLEESVIEGLVNAVKKHKLGDITGVKLNALAISNALDRIAKSLKTAIKDYDETSSKPKGEKSEESEEEPDDSETEEGDELEGDENSEDSETEEEVEDDTEDVEVENDTEESSYHGRKTIIAGASNNSVSGYRKFVEKTSAEVDHIGELKTGEKYEFCAPDGTILKGQRMSLKKEENGYTVKVRVEDSNKKRNIGKALSIAEIADEQGSIADSYWAITKNYKE